MGARSALSRLACTLLGYLYPALASAKAAVQEDTEAGTVWITYWVVISMFTCLEFAFDLLVFWFPLYYELKIAFIIWLTLPRYQGAATIYSRLVHPYFCRFEDDIDGHLQDVQKRASMHIRSLTTTVATEVCRAVSRQGASVKEQLLATAFRLAASDGSEPPETRRARPAAGPSGGLASPEEDDEVLPDAQPADAAIAAGNADEVLAAFRELLRQGIYLPVRQDGEASPCSRCVKLLADSRCTLLVASARSQGARDAATGSLYEVATAEAPPEATVGPLLLHTQVGQVELHASPAERDTLLAGFQLMLAAPAAAALSE